MNFKNVVQTFLNKCVFGMEHSAAQWMLPVTNEGKELDSVTVSNWQVRQFIDKLEGLPLALVKNASWQERWLCMLQK